MANLEMKVSSEVYEEKIELLRQQIEKLTAVTERYSQLESRIDVFLSEQDSTFEAVRENVRASTEAARRACAIASSAREALSRELEEFTSHSQESQRRLEEAGEAVRATVSTRLPVDELLD